MNAASCARLRGLRKPTYRRPMPRAEALNALTQALDQLTAENGALVNAGVVVSDGGGLAYAHAAGQCAPSGAPFTLETNLRFASVSKAVTARAVCALAVAGEVDLLAPINAVLGRAFTHPSQAPITLADLLTHRADLTDRAGYYADPPQALSEFFAHAAPFAGRGPGRYFAYSNLGYVLAGAALERASGQRFDEAVARLVLDPIGVAGRFNWHAMPPSARAHRTAICRKTADGFAPQIDAHVEIEGLHDRTGRPVDLGAYRLAEDVSVFSPHAGLRMSLADALRLADAIGEDAPTSALQRAPHWRFDPSTNNGESVHGLFVDYRLGLQYHPPSDWYGGELLGHFGSAFGFSGAVWRDTARGLSIAYALNGLPETHGGEDRESFYGPIERMILNRIDQAFG